jgi:hypothetical protein
MKKRRPFLTILGYRLLPQYQLVDLRLNFLRGGERKSNEGDGDGVAPIAPRGEYDCFARRDGRFGRRTWGY